MLLMLESTCEWKFAENKIEEGGWIQIFKNIHNRSSICFVSVPSVFPLLFQLHPETNTS